MKKIRLLFLTLVALIAGAASSSAKTVYIQPGNWSNDNAIISVNVWGDGENTWVENLTEVETGIFKATIGDGKTTMAVVRGTEANKWKSEGAWNQTGDITITDGKLYKLYDYDNSMDGIYLGHGVVEEDYTEPVAAGYLCDFNTVIAVPTSNTASPVFQVSIGWTRIAPSAAGDGYGPYYMLYNYSSTAGVGESGTLLANAQCAPQSTYDGTISTVNDYIVTPKVSGTVTLMVKGSTSASSSYPSFITFYAIDDDATTVGDEIIATLSGDINNDNFVTATLTLTEATRIAIRGQWVYLDNFTATEAEVPEVKSLTVTSVMSEAGQSGTTGTNPIFEQQSDGKLLVKLKVAVQNTGSVALVAGTTEDYTLTLATASYTSGAKTYYEDTPIAITENLAVGASTTIEVEQAVNYTDTYGSYRYWFVRENVSGTTSSSNRYATSVAYEPKFIFRAAESTSTSSLSGTQAYGLIGEETTNHYEIANTGTAPLIIKSITLPEGFTSANLPEIPTEGLSIAKGTAHALDITLPITTMGSFSGNLTIVYLDKNNAEQTYTLPFSGKVLAAGTWAADFNVASSSETNYPAGSVAENGIRFGTSYVSSNNYDGYLYSYTSSSYANQNNKFITPKLHANAGDKLAFDVRRDDSSSSTYKLKVYVSTDRKTWGEPVYSVTAADLTSTFQTKEISFDTAGDYYVAFAIYGVRVDNIIGLTKVDVTHDLYIKEVTWPDATIKSGVSQSSKPKVTIIPLTTETADAYTVKYVCGETVLATVDSKALTASASSTTDFEFTWTPNVESTTLYPATKVVFDFGGGVTFETETFDLTVVKEPKFHFVKTLPSSKWYEPDDYTTPITFGKTNSADVQTYYINNWGSAPLTVNSIALPAGFTTSVEAPLTIAAYDGTNEGISAASQALDIIFSATEAGEYSGDMVITYVDGAGADQTFTLAVSGTKLDPNKFYANFDNATENVCNWPAGSVYQSNVSGSASTSSAPYLYTITSNSTTNNIFATPKLTATAGEKLQFDAKLFNSSWSEGKVVVYAAATREEVLNAEEGTTRQQLFSVSGQDETGAMTTDYQTFEVPALAGDYYYGFEISGRPYVDEIYGLSLAEVAHDWQIVSSNIPSEATQNVAFTATVNILNLGLADEAADSYTVTAYLDGEAVATGEAVAIPMNHKLNDTGTQLSVSILSAQTGEFPVYLEVKAGDYSVATDPVNVLFGGEVFVSEAKQVGTQTSTGRDYGFVDWYNNDGSNTKYTDILYTAAKISAAGIKAGDKIKAITFKATNSAKTFNAVVTSWVGVSTGDITYGSPTKADMQEVSVYNGSTAFAANEESVITLPEVIVWDGTSDIRVYTEAVGQGSGNWMSASYGYDSEITMSYNGTKKAGTIAFFSLEEEAPALSGTVTTSAGTGIEGATVTLKAENGVQYSGTTAADGTYSINVIQASLDFTATVEAEGYLKRQFDYSLGGQSKTLDVTLYRQMGIVGDPAMGLSWDEDAVMEQDAEDPNIFTLLKTVTIENAGTYYYKLRADGKYQGNGNDQLPNGYQLPMNGNNNYNFTQAGTYKLKFTADVANHTLTLELPYVLADTNTEDIVAQSWANIDVQRKFKAGWNAVVLPFDITNDNVIAVFGENTEVAVFDGDEGSGNVSIKFKKTEEGIKAGVPCLLWLENAKDGFEFNAEVKADLIPASGTNFNFVGVYAQTTVNTGDMFIKDGKFVTATTNNYVLPFRSYLQLKGAGVRSVSITIGEETITTAIDGLTIESNDNVIYNLGGQKVQNAKKGLYIINGKKVVVK